MVQMIWKKICALLVVFVTLVVVGGGDLAFAKQTNGSTGLSAETAITDVLNEKPKLFDSVFGLRLALLPLADISEFANGINLEMTHDLALTLQDRGVELVSEGDVLQFMADNRIRFAGYLDSLLARKLGRELECDLILLGTVTEIGGKVNPALGLTLTAMDTNSGSPVWAATRATSISDQVRLLGLGEAQSLEDLKRPLLNELLNEFQQNVPESLPEKGSVYQIVSARVTPSYVQGGEVVDFRLEIRFVDNPPKQILLDTKIGVVPLYRGKVGSLYLGHWVAPASAGAYPLALMFDWGRGGLSPRMTNVAAYNVINEAPQLQVKLGNGLKIGDITAFRGSLIILPELKGTTPISHWSITVKNEKGQTFLHEDHDGVLPARLVWQGNDMKRRRLQDGLYEMYIDVWDVAGNHSGSLHKVALKRSTVPVQVASVIRDGKTYLQIEQGDSSVVPVTEWTVKVASLEGTTLLNKQGGFLPALLELPYLGADSTVLCDIEVEDTLGNFLSLTETKVKVEVDEAQVAQKVEHAADSWVEDF